MSETREAALMQQAERAMRLARAISAKRCSCGNIDWRVVQTAGRVRYVTCRCCGRHEKVVAD